MIKIEELTKKYNNFKSIINGIFDKDYKNSNKNGTEKQELNEKRLEKLIKKAEKKLKEGEKIAVIKGKVYIKKLHDKLYLSFEKIKEHVLVTGKTRVGKSVLMKRIIRMFLEYRRQHPEQKMQKRFCVIDIKGDFTQQFYDELDFILLNPFDQRGYGIEIFSLIVLETDIPSISSSLVPDSPGTDPVFIQGPRQIVECAIYHCIRKGTTTNKALSDFLKLSAQEMLIEISYQITTEDGKKVRKAYKNCEVLFSQLSSSQGAIFLSSAVTYFDAIYSLANSKRNIVLQDYIKNDTRNIIIPNFSRISSKMTPIISLFVNQLALFMLSGKVDPNNNYLFILDEFSSLKKMGAIEDILQKGAEFGVSLMVLLQEYGKAEQLYGKSFQTFFNNSGTKFFFQIIDAETRKTIQDYIGTQTLMERTENHSSGDTDSRDGFSNNYQKTTKNALTDNSVFQGLNKQEFFYSESGVSDKKDGNTFIYTGRITGFFNPLLDIYPAKVEHFIHNKDIEIDFFTKKALLAIESEKPVLDDEEDEIKIKVDDEVEETKDINNKEKKRTRTELKSSIKEKYNNIKSSKGEAIIPPNLDFVEEKELSDDELNDSPFV